MRKHLSDIYTALLTIVVLLWSSYAGAQAYAEINGPMTIGTPSGATMMSRELYIGPQAVITVNGDWRIASEKIYISPTAVISGSGTIIFDHPAIYTIGANALTWTGQSIDGGGAMISCAVLISNPGGTALVNIPPAAALGYIGDTLAGIILSSRLSFAGGMTGNNLALNDFNATVTSLASITGYTTDHFIVTNGQGRLVKENVDTAGFTFPVGVAAGDYTPARIVNDGTADNYSVRVMPGTDPANPIAAGINRTWDISEASAGGSDVTLTLQHNLTTGPGGPATADPLYDDAAAYVAASTPLVAAWDSSTQGAGIVPGTLTDGTPVTNSSVLSRPYISDFSVRTRFTKFYPLPGASIWSVKTAIPDSVFLYDDFRYHIKLINTGGVTLVPPIWVSDTLPGGAQFISASGPGFTTSFSNNIVTAIYNDSLRSGDSVEFDIWVKAMSQDLRNVAYVHVPRVIVTVTAGCDTCDAGTPAYPWVMYRPIRIPDAISPNGDGINDLFVITNLLHFYPKATVSIYNRNGDEVWFSGGPYQNDFSGVNYNGAVLPDATYYYVLYYNDGSNRKESHFLDISR